MKAFWNNMEQITSNFMIQEQIVSWIFLAIAMASETTAANLTEISMIADGINHAIPTPRELQSSISWLIKNDLIIKQERRYHLSEKGKLEYENASENNKVLFNIWKNLEKNIAEYN
ncbi:hypothetical protein IWX84_002779 [Flavobacterium sp. CG_9.10]|uniref:hypothetical protein n=1 Tax=Flavobacterium sp. CG_9.10 TaxID=2787729 RepID=UPI0018C98092|nr:hypothetical protein [Flavobacterium sp. CG_9.10]MBG6111888.1 hypothetical protein [Flavobacterium sp. CG_9.10]